MSLGIRSGPARAREQCGSGLEHGTGRTAYPLFVGPELRRRLAGARRTATLLAACLTGARTYAHNGDIMNSERRGDGRARFAGVFANKYIDGIPHVVELLDVSASGLKVRRILEPESAATTYPLELSVGGVTLWAWTRRVWRRGSREALRIVSADSVDRARLRKFLRAAMAA